MSRIACALVVSLASASSALGQGRGPGGVGHSGPRVREDARTFFPMVQTGVWQNEIRPTNPTRPEIGDSRRNRLRPGGRRTARRPSGEALFPGIEFNGSRPPDPHIAVGPDAIVQVTNSQVAVFDKAGKQLFQQALNTGGFFRGVATRNFVYDPKVVFDAADRRFYLVALEYSNQPQASGLLFAASDGPDPLGGWSKWRIETRAWRDGRTYWFDYPSLGFSRDGIVVTGNMFPFLAGQPWTQSLGIKKASLATAGPLPYYFWTHERTPTVQAARSAPGDDGTVYGAALGTTSSLRILAWRGFDRVPRLVETNVTLPTFTVFGSRVPTAGGATIDPVSDRLMEAARVGSSLYAAHTVQVSPADPRASVRWYEVDLGAWPDAGSPALRQTGAVVASGNGHFCMPAIGADERGTVCLVMTGSGRTGLPDLYAAVRAAQDPLGAMGAPTVVGSSLARPIDDASRWGDYFAVVPDPVEQGRFWGTGQVTRADGDWSTVIVSWTVP